MRRISGLLLIAVIFFFISLEGCKKYPDGPRISFRSKTERVAGLWRIVSVQVNGTEQNMTLVNGLQAPYEKQSFEYTKDGKVVWIWDSFLENPADPFSSSIPGISYNGEWKFNENKSKILRKMEGETDWTELEIFKLKNNEFWYQTVTGSNTTEVHLESN